jgi:hypothetical protein
LPSAPPTIASTVPARNSQKVPATARRTTPAAIDSKAPASTWESRNRAESAGPANPIAAKQSTGIVVTTPASPLLMPRPSSISWSTGPMLVTAVRRLRPVRTIAVPMRSSPREVSLVCGEGAAVRVTSAHGPPCTAVTCVRVVSPRNDL